MNVGKATFSSYLNIRQINLTAKRRRKAESRERIINGSSFDDLSNIHFNIILN